MDSTNYRVRLVAAGTGVITTFAGTGVADFGGDGGPATSARLNYPQGLAVDQSGNVLIADYYNHRIRRVAVGSGVITTVVGNGVGGFSGDGGPATSASLYQPAGVAVDGSGNVFISDTDNHRVRRVAVGSGVITTLAGNGVSGFSGDSGPATSAGLNRPHGLAVDESGNVLIADVYNHRIRRVVAETGVITTLAGNGVGGFSGDGGHATSAGLNRPGGKAVDGSGNVLITDMHNHRIRRVAADFITTLAGNGVGGFGGDGGPATSAGLNYPAGIAVDGSGNALVTDLYNHRIRLIAAPSQPTRSPTPSPSTTLYCAPALFRPLPRTDLVGALVGTALAPGDAVLLPTVAACRQACCDAAACDGYSFDAGASRSLPQASCYLLVNVTQLVPSSGYVSGIRELALL